MPDFRRIASMLFPVRPVLFFVLPVLLFILMTGAGCTRYGTFLWSGFEVGLWVQAEGTNRTLDSVQKMDRLILQARAAGVTDLYVQVYRSGRAWFPTPLADDRPSRRAGRDPLAYLIKKAGPLRIHAWINAFSLARNSRAPIIRELGPGALLHDQHGRSMQDYPRSGRPPWASGFSLGTPGLFLDPAHPGVRKRIAGIAQALVRRYPRLSGIHLDFIRYPYALPISPGSRFSPRLDFGYGKGSIKRFAAETGRRAPSAGARVSAADHRAWDGWRRDQVTRTVAAVRAAIRKVRPGAVLSAAVLPWAERAYLIAFQDWRGWLRSGLIDKALVMVYSRDTALAAHMMRAAMAARPGLPETLLQDQAAVVIGLGAWLFGGDPSPLWAQWKAAQRAGADGVALFSYDQMVDRPQMWRRPIP